MGEEIRLGLQLQGLQQAEQKQEKGRELAEEWARHQRRHVSRLARRNLQVSTRCERPRERAGGLQRRSGRHGRDVGGPFRGQDDSGQGVSK